ncbi:MAG: hypothetical protein HYS32_04135 [Candidatus Woesearchaeota archaeon]|nr:MAG: hypothetical protein HYS32_04135 [Candidatus Woesearchaeota archaeon]
MNRELFPNGTSNHSMIVLGSLDEHFNGVPEISAVNGSSHQTRGNYDLVLVGNGDLYRTVAGLSRVPGLFASRTLIVLEERHRQGRRDGEHSGLLLLDSMHGRDEEVSRELRRVEGIYGVYKTVGIYGIAALVSFDDEQTFRARVNKVKGIRSATLVETDVPVNPIEVVTEPQLISARHYNTRNKYETGYVNREDVNRSYAEGCVKMARSFVGLQEMLGYASVIWAPLRGAKPIVDAMLEAYRRLQEEGYDCFVPNVQFPVTSSFVFYPETHPYLTRKGRRPASGRASHVLELRRALEKNPEDLGNVLYADEIISGGMVLGHVREMVEAGKSRKGILQERIISGATRLSVFGLVDENGRRFRSEKKAKLLGLQGQRRLRFSEFGVDRLVTEDNRFLLGNHYLLNQLGPHVVPFVDKNRAYSPEHALFWAEVVNQIERALVLSN